MGTEIKNIQDYNAALDQLDKMLSDPSSDIEHMRSLTKELYRYERECIEWVKEQLLNDGRTHDSCFKEQREDPST